MAFSFPLATLRRGHHLHGLGMMGDVSIAGWKAGTKIHYHNDSMLHNSFSGYSDSAVQQAFANSGLFIPTTVAFTSSPNFLGLSTTIDLYGVLPVDVNQADVSRVIEGLIKNFYVSSPSTAKYDPAPNISQAVDSSGAVVGPVAVAPKTAANYGIDSVLGYPTDSESDFDVIFTDGSSGLFDAQGAYYAGTQDGIAEVGNLESDSGTQIGYFALLNDGTELYFDMSGTYTDSNASYSGGTPGAGGATQIVQTNQNPGAQPPKPAGYDWSKIVNSFGLSGLMAALGIGAGTTLIVAGVGLYVFMNGFPGSKRR